MATTAEKYTFFSSTQGKFTKIKQVVSPTMLNKFQRPCNMKTTFYDHTINLEIKEKT